MEYYDEKKQKQFQEASVVILAAWSAQNPRLLLNSRTATHEKGLSNSSGLVGKYMMAHHIAATWALFDEDVQNHMGTASVQYMSYDHYKKTTHPNAFRSALITAGHALKTAELANSRGDLFGQLLERTWRRQHATSLVPTLLGKSAVRQVESYIRPRRTGVVEREHQGRDGRGEGQWSERSVAPTGDAHRAPIGRNNHGD